MSDDPSIDDRMTANGYVRCGGCGGYLPAGAICGYCLQRQQNQMLMQQPAARPRTKPRPVRTAVMLLLCALAVCGVGFGAVFALKSVAGKSTPLSSRTGSNPLNGLTEDAEGAGTDTLSSRANQQLVQALNSGDTQQALTALQATGSTGSSTMQAVQAPQTPTMQNGPASTPATLEAQPKGMPDNVRNWLEHLRKTEQARITLATAQLEQSVKTLTGLQAGDMTHAMDDDGSDSVSAEKAKENDRAQKVGGDMATMEQAWKTLLSAFDSVPAPAECVGIKANYDQVVGQTGIMILDIVSKINSASSDPQGALAALTAMQGTSKSKIDVPARAADSGVSDVCKRYDTVKWFDIQSDVGSGTMSQLGF